ncbi:MAG: hypothetical protein M0Z82_10880, partial [Actinomycetota bacterium]|nr:hypothetical protein [Actinomycetota bacterium]
PDEAFKPIEGDDKSTATARKKANVAERRQRNQGLLALGDSALSATGYLADAVRAIDTEDDTTVNGIQRKQHRWAELQAARETQLAKLVADTWCAAFFAPKTPEHPALTDQTLRAIAGDRTDSPDAIALVVDLAAHHRFLHPHLAFPDVFVADPEAEDGWQGGFDLVLGNPPWDTLSPDQREFFARYQPGMRSLGSREQTAVIEELLTDETIAVAWSEYRRDLFASVHFFKGSGRYTLFAEGNLGKGDFNVYRMFVETALRTTRPGGFTAQITPGGLYGGANASAIRKHLLDRCQLTALYGFSNYKKRWFQIDMARFAAYVAMAGGRTKSFITKFGMENPAELAAVSSLTIDADSIRHQEPLTYAIPEVRNAAALDMSQRIYANWPPFGRDIPGLPYRDFRREVDMGNDRDLFTDDPSGLPVYEGRMVALRPSSEDLRVRPRQQRGVAGTTLRRPEEGHHPPVVRRAGGHSRQTWGPDEPLSRWLHECHQRSRSSELDGSSASTGCHLWRSGADALVSCGRAVGLHADTRSAERIHHRLGCPRQTHRGPYDPLSCRQPSNTAASPR